MEYKDLSPELRAKAKACTSPEELLTLAKEEGYKLSDADLEAVSGGAWAFGSQSACTSYHGGYGDTRVDVDSSQAHEEYINGTVDGGEQE